MFLEKRVYQGSSGKVYPLPFTDRIEEEPVDHEWRAIWIENEYLKVMILPEIGGRIHIIYDKTNNCDVIYRQDVIKPALVGLAGPWISGGIEFNWPQHHRPATFLPVDTQIETHDDGAVTVWCGDHDPMTRMKGMHGVCLHPGKSLIEIKARAYNRTPFVQTFLWWANVAVEVHEGYQSFFPADVSHIADHAKRATSEYPFCWDRYYGVNYGERARHGTPVDERPAQFVPPAISDSADPRIPIYPPNDLSWYSNIPVPTSYMCVESHGDFFGGYDHMREAGIVHIANRHISPGKKQWTWGNHEFGYAWDRNLTDAGGPYIELMAGVYTDNQPDFSFLEPGETKSWSQYWYPLQKSGPAHQANKDLAISLTLSPVGVRIGVSASRPIPNALIHFTLGGGTEEWHADLAPGRPFSAIHTSLNAQDFDAACVYIFDGDENEIIRYAPGEVVANAAPQPATEPPSPVDTPSVEELYLTGLHLEQYRHATRSPVPYWTEGLRRDPDDVRCNNALGLWRLRRGELAEAETHFRTAIARLMRRNPNPYDGEAFYNLGLCLRTRIDSGEEAQNLCDDAYAAFYKAAWNQGWGAAAYHALAEMDCRRGEWETAIDHLDRSLRLNADNLRARDLKTVALRHLGRLDDANRVLEETLALDPLDWWAQFLKSDSPLHCDTQTRLDLAHDFARAGLYADACTLLAEASAPAPSQNLHDLPTQSWGAEPLRFYTLGWIQERMGDFEAAAASRRIAKVQSPDYCFPSRLEEIAVLQSAMEADPADARAPRYLANLMYDRRRYDAAMAFWERSVALDASSAVVWRCLGIGYANAAKNPDRARDAYDRAVAADPEDARLVFERDQLWKRLGVSPEVRLAELRKRADLIRRRDDLTVEFCALCNQTGRSEEALETLLARRFQPWEGGEGQALGQYVRACLALGRAALAAGRPKEALERFTAALCAPPSIGEAKHLLANQSDIHFALGEAYAALRDTDAAWRSWTAAATFKGDFQEMSVRSFSEMTCYSALAWRRLGDQQKADDLLNGLLEYATELVASEAKIDYFATSLPTMLLFDEDIQERQTISAWFLQAQANAGLGRFDVARTHVAAILARDPSHALASDLNRELANAGAAGIALGDPILWN